MTPRESSPLISVSDVCHLLASTGLLSANDVRQLAERWEQAAGSAATQPQRFRQWLVDNQYVTGYQADRLFRGHSDYYFLNQYKLLDRIGKGRMAGVYKAVHQVGQVVAIKVLPPSRARDANTFARFCREARLARRLQHPNVVRTFQTGEWNGLYFLVMEYLEGETLQEVLDRRQQLPPAEAVRLMVQALEGLQHIHEKGLVHRDLEPGNLMLVPARQVGEPDTTRNSTVKILDIGLGRVTFGEAEEDSGPRLTAADAILGPPHYMAPEQARNSRTADIRADLYSLGCILYHALAGQPPFPEKLAVRAMIRHATDVPAPLEQFNPYMPEGLQPFMSTLLAKDPAKRYASPKEAAQALRRFLTTTQLVPPSVPAPVPAYLAWVEANPEPVQLAVSPGPATVAWQPAPPQVVPQPVPPLPSHRPQPVAPVQAARPLPEPIPLTLPAPRIEVVPVPGEIRPEGFSLTRGDWLFLALGGGFLLVVVVVAWFFLRQ